MYTSRQIKRQGRRPIATLVGTAAIAATLLSSCGFNMATDRPYTQAAGDNDVAKQQKVLNALIVSGTEGEGTFVATLSNNDYANAVSFNGVQPTTPGAFEASEVTPVDIAPGGALNLAIDGGVKVSGEFRLGNFVSVTVTFGNGETVQVDAPVVEDAGQWAGLDVEAPTPSPETPTSDPATEAPSE